jgi:pSer/pThr/pTyr-binding forkhead associated (FHA) protein
MHTLTSSASIARVVLEETKPHAILFDLETGDLNELAADAITIGSSDKSAVRISGPKVSPQHCLIIRYSDGYRLYDLNSRSGCSVNGVKINENCQLFDGDEISIGDFSFVFNLVKPQSTNGTANKGTVSWVKSFGKYLFGMNRTH